VPQQLLQQLLPQLTLTREAGTTELWLLTYAEWHPTPDGQLPSYTCIAEDLGQIFCFFFVSKAGGIHPPAEKGIRTAFRDPKEQKAQQQPAATATASRREPNRSRGSATHLHHATCIRNDPSELSCQVTLQPLFRSYSAPSQTATKQKRQKRQEQQLVTAVCHTHEQMDAVLSADGCMPAPHLSMHLPKWHLCCSSHYVLKKQQQYKGISRGAHPLQDATP